MSFLGKANFCTNGHSQLHRLCHVIQSDMLTVYDPPTHLLSPVHFSFSALHQLEQLSHLQQNPVPCNFHFLMWLLLQMACPLIGLFIFRDLFCHCQLVDPGLVLCVGLILPCRSSRELPWCCVEWLSAYLVRWVPCIWITALQKLICVIKVVHYLLFFPGWPARYWLWSTSTLLLLFQHIFLPISMWRLIICPGVSCFWNGIFSLRWPKKFFTLWVYQRWICWYPPIPLSTSIITP